MSFFRILSTKQRITVAALLATGALISLFSAGQIAEHEAAENRFDFELSAGDGAVVLQRNIDDLLQALRSVTYFYSSSEFVDRRQFATFVEPLLRRYEGLQALEWIPRVRGSERHIYESQARADGFADFVIREADGNGAMVRAGNRDQYFPFFTWSRFPATRKSSALTSVRVRRGGKLSFVRAIRAPYAPVPGSSWCRRLRTNRESSSSPPCTAAAKTREQLSYGAKDTRDMPWPLFASAI